jgi:hypothetical protein
MLPFYRQLKSPSITSVVTVGVAPSEAHSTVTEQPIDSMARQTLTTAFTLKMLKIIPVNDLRMQGAQMVRTLKMTLLEF